MTQTPHASMNTLLRFWSDIENVERAPHQAIQNDILEYLKWVQDEKARADTAEAQLHALQIMANSETRRADTWRLGFKGLNDSLNAAEARELRIRTELESMMPDMWPGMREHFEVLLSTIYPDTPAQP